MRPPFLLIPDKILQKNQITEPGSLADLLPALMDNAGSCAKCGSDGKEPNAHGEFETHAHKKVRRPSAYISTHSLLSNIISIPHGLVLQIVQEFLGILNIWRGPAPN